MFDEDGQELEVQYYLHLDRGLYIIYERLCGDRQVYGNMALEKSIDVVGEYYVEGERRD
jgi:hypothetical protein